MILFKFSDCTEYLFDFLFSFLNPFVVFFFEKAIFDVLIEILVLIWDVDRLGFVIDFFGRLNDIKRELIDNLKWFSDFLLICDNLSLFSKDLEILFQFCFWETFKIEVPVLTFIIIDFSLISFFI